MDDRRVASGIAHVIRDGLQRQDAPAGHGPPRTLHNRFVRRSRPGVLNRIFDPLAAQGPRPERT